ncbi:DUF896 domain-containing protein [Tumebacillus permanentifrigoris]|uniref:UPF0291 protein C7459_11823 n=1 Tax=Tumebacillus permanentifrigoris TaxID=378543 RepID=A0A316D8J2_9BACL|nr:DUF896 domain-containing protein [Tumebacillus permanentifrigoris]PWK06959.1 uncharacterized protein YnzC (UPF0291/DUF896 family) [Tumebacillus permanentifrigoris]
MLSSDKIDRINVLARKKKDGTMTPEEASEQVALRAEYMEAFRKEFRSQLDSIKFVEDEEGYQH